jgi:methylenetetrahydrofolate reductase (NADPH)
VIVPVSFEFFPARHIDGQNNLLAAQKLLKKLNPEFYSVTFGAGGGTRDLTLQTAINTVKNTGIMCVPHISCSTLSVQQIQNTLELYKKADVSQLVVLRGDTPSGGQCFSELRHASELVELVKASYGEQFYINVAAYPEVHPQAASSAIDLKNFKTKVEAGADCAITQYFYNTDAYFRFVDRCLASGIDIPIVPGIMPIINFANLERFSAMCGAEIPRWLRMRLQDFDDGSAEMESYGVDIVSNVCERLIDGGAPKLHFYTMNRGNPSLRICENLSLEI